MIALLNGWRGWLIFLVLGFGAGWQAHGWRFDAAEGQSIKHGLKVAQELNVKADEVVEAKIEQEQAVRIVYRTIKEKINDVQDDRVCFTSESLSLWNAAVSGADTHRPEPAGEAREASPAADEQATTKEVLGNAATNFEICNSNSIKHNALIDAVESYKGKMCVCDQ